MSKPSRASKIILSLSLLILTASIPAFAQDVPGSKDPAGMKRYEGSELIGYREPKFDEYLLPLAAPTQMSPPAYKKSKKIEDSAQPLPALALRIVEDLLAHLCKYLSPC